MQKFLLVNYQPPMRLWHEETKTETYQTDNEVPFLWLTLKSYFKRNSKNPEAWDWLLPIQSTFNENEMFLVDEIVEQNPDVLGISCYVWNERLTMYVAEKVKERLPNIKIIAGGPSILYSKDKTYFKKYWFIDAVCEYTGYGEVFITEYLDGTPIEKIPYAVYPTMKRSWWEKSTEEFSKRSFKFPMPYFDNQDFLKTFAKNDVRLILDSSRGCMYSCTFCEWGGGTSTKVIFKPLEDMILDLEAAFSILKPRFMDIINANFGIEKNDIQIAKKIVEINNKNGNCMKYIIMNGPTKTKKKDLKEIFDVLLGGNIGTDLRIPIQHIDETILKNIERIDTPLDEQIELFKSLSEKYNTPLSVEVILGLPGETLKTFYNLSDKLLSYMGTDLNVVTHWQEWQMLSSAPAADSSYMEKMKIKTKNGFYIESYKENLIKPKNKINAEIDKTKKRELLLDKNWSHPYELVVSTYSYTMEDYAQMQLYKCCFAFLNETKIFKPLIKYIIDKGYKFEGFSESLFNDCLLKMPILDKTYRDYIQNLNSESDYFDSFFADIAPNLPRMSYYTVLKFLMLIDKDNFFKRMEEWLLNRYDNDRNFSLLCRQISDIISSPMQNKEKEDKEKIIECLKLCNNFGLDDVVDYDKLCDISNRELNFLTTHI
jgi:radical SAM superfamily enzyme YgiQ (UPF0313 family)